MDNIRSVFLFENTNKEISIGQMLEQSYTTNGGKRMPTWREALGHERGDLEEADEQLVRVVKPTFKKSRS